MNTKQLLTLLAAAAAATSARAATISWTVSTITGAATDISNIGTTVIAASGSDGGTNANVVDNVTVATVNGVAFTDALTVQNATHFDTLGTRANSGVTGAYYDMLRFADRRGTGDATYTFTGLTVGTTYQIQLWAQDNVSTHLVNGIVLNNGGLATTPNPATSGHVTLLLETGLSLPGQFATGTFVADSDTQSFLARAWTNLTTTPAAGSNTTINAYQLRAIPEPSAALLGGLCLLTLLRRRRS